MPLLPQLLRPEQLQAWRASPCSVIRPTTAAAPLLLEIHDPSDRVPPHRHVYAVEMFFVLRGWVW